MKKKGIIHAVFNFRRKIFANFSSHQAPVVSKFCIWFFITFFLFISFEFALSENIFQFDSKFFVFTETKARSLMFWIFYSSPLDFYKYWEQLFKKRSERIFQQSTWLDSLFGLNSNYDCTMARTVFLPAISMMLNFNFLFRCRHV